MDRAAAAHEPIRRPALFAQTVRVLRLPGVQIDTAEQRSAIADYWNEACKQVEYRFRDKPTAVGVSGMKEYHMMQNFVLDAPDILAAIASEIADTDLDRFLETAFAHD